jgi:hypothetical protein
MDKNKYYTDQKNFMKKHLNLDKQYTFKFSIEENTNNNIVDIYLNDKLVLKAQYCFIGIYNLLNSVWYWAWNLEYINKTLSRDIKKAVKYTKRDLIDNYSKYNPEEADEMYFYCANNNFFLSSENVDKLIKVALYVSKVLWIMPTGDGKEKFEYIGLTKILQSNLL